MSFFWWNRSRCLALKDGLYLVSLLVNNTRKSGFWGEQLNKLLTESCRHTPMKPVFDKQTAHQPPSYANAALLLLYSPHIQCDSTTSHILLSPSLSGDHSLKSLVSSTPPSQPSLPPKYFPLQETQHMSLFVKPCLLDLVHPMWSSLHQRHQACSRWPFHQTQAPCLTWPGRSPGC